MDSRFLPIETEMVKAFPKTSLKLVTYRNLRLYPD